MKFMFVVGGSYKGFYINELKKINKIDLLIFNKDIFYDFDYEREYLGDALVSKELIALNKKLNCPIVVWGKSNLMDKQQKCFIICVNGKVSLIDCLSDIYLYVNGKIVIVGAREYKRQMGFAMISMLEGDCNLPKNRLNNYVNYFICNKRWVGRLQNGIIYKKFRKCCYFSLCFHKKMI